MIAGICTFHRLPCPCTKRQVILNLNSTGVCDTGTSLYVCNLLLWLPWWWMLLYRTLRKVKSTNMRKSMYFYVVTPRCAAAVVVSAVVLPRPTKEYTHPYSMMHRRLPTAGTEVAPHYHQLVVPPFRNADIPMGHIEATSSPAPYYYDDCGARLHGCPENDLRIAFSSLADSRRTVDTHVARRYSYLLPIYQSIAIYYKYHAQEVSLGRIRTHAIIFQLLIFFRKEWYTHQVLIVSCPHRLCIISFWPEM